MYLGSTALWLAHGETFLQGASTVSELSKARCSILHRLAPVPPEKRRRLGPSLPADSARRIERRLPPSWVQVVHPIVTTGRVRGARERASRIPDSLAVPL